jgi:predicted DNA-binding protein (MmcQ/YjbR family)
MKYQWIADYAETKKGAKCYYKEVWDCYILGFVNPDGTRDKMFGMIGQDGKNRDILSVKLEPEWGAILREEYEEVIAGWHLNKLHWNSVFLETDFPKNKIKEMIDESYQLVLEGFPKSKQTEINNGYC